MERAPSFLSFGERLFLRKNVAESAGQLEHDDSADDEHDSQDTPEGERVIPEQNPDGHGPGGTDSGPDGVGSPDGDCFLGQVEEKAANDHRDHSHDGAADFMSVGNFESYGPRDFEEPRYDEIKPCHIDSLFLRTAQRPKWPQRLSGREPFIKICRQQSPLRPAYSLDSGGLHESNSH